MAARWCGSCGTQLPDQAKFCGGCGQPVLVDPTPAPARATVPEHGWDDRAPEPGWAALAVEDGAGLGNDRASAPQAATTPVPEQTWSDVGAAPDFVPDPEPPSTNGRNGHHAGLDEIGFGPQDHPPADPPGPSVIYPASGPTSDPGTGQYGQGPGHSGQGPGHSGQGPGQYGQGADSVPPASGYPPPGYQAAGYPPPGYQAPPPAAGPAPWVNRPGEDNGLAWQSERSGPGQRDLVDALLGGDWRGAALAAACATGVMIVLSVLALVLVGVSGANDSSSSFSDSSSSSDGGASAVHLLISVVAILTCGGWGGDLFGRAGSSFSASGNGSLGLLPLTLTFAGLGVLVFVFLKRIRGAGLRDVLFQALRTLVVLGAITFVLALVSRFHASPSDGSLFDVEGTLGAGVASSVVGSILFSIAGLSIGVFLTRPDVLPPRLRQFQAAARAPIFAAAAVYLVGLAATLGGLIWSMSTQDEPFAQLAVALLGLPNAALGAVLLTMGVPLNGRGSSTSSVADAAGSSSDHLTLLTLTEQSSWWWIAPVVLALALIAAVVVIVVRQHTLRDARREALRFAAWFAGTALIAALLLRVAGEGNGQLLASDVTGRFSILFNPLAAAFAAALWGLAAAVVGPQAATQAGGGLVGSVRRRFGTAAHTAPPPTRPAPPQQPYGYQP